MGLSKKKQNTPFSGTWDVTTDIYSKASHEPPRIVIVIACWCIISSPKHDILGRTFESCHNAASTGRLATRILNIEPAHKSISQLTSCNTYLIAIYICIFSDTHTHTHIYIYIFHDSSAIVIIAKNCLDHCTILQLSHFSTGNDLSTCPDYQKINSNNTDV